MRYYEKQGMMDHNVRTEGGYRLYTEQDLQRLRFAMPSSWDLLWKRSLSCCRSASIRTSYLPGVEVDRRCAPERSGKQVGGVDSHARIAEAAE
ncbi:MerR family transcriptional regulator [Serratia ureilytica]